MPDHAFPVCGSFQYQQCRQTQKEGFCEQTDGRRNHDDTDQTQDIGRGLELQVGKKQAGQRHKDKSDKRELQPHAELMETEGYKQTAQ